MRAVVTCCLFLGLAGPAAAGQERSSWGVSASVVPRWRVPQEAKILFDADVVDVQGAEIRVGFVRGRTLSGDWGISFVRKTFTDGSRVRRDEGTSCFGTFGCFTDSTTFASQNVLLTGVEMHKFGSIATIRQRVQIGVTFAGGVAQVRGTVERRQLVPEFGNQSGAISGVSQREQVDSAEGRELFVGGTKTVPLARLELAVATILRPGVKVRVSGGANLPGYQVVSLTFVYLFGGH